MFEAGCFILTEWTRSKFNMLTKRTFLKFHSRSHILGFRSWLIPYSLCVHNNFFLFLKKILLLFNLIGYRICHEKWRRRAIVILRGFYFIRQFGLLLLTFLCLYVRVKEIINLFGGGLKDFFCIIRGFFEGFFTRWVDDICFLF